MPSMPDKIKAIYAAQRDVREAHRKLDDILSAGPASFYDQKMVEYLDGLLSFAKFPIGSSVQLADDVDCDNKPGWVHCEHFLKKGARAIVSEIDYHKGRFVYAVIFDEESWIDLHKQRQVVRAEDRHRFWFSETSFEATL